MGGKVDGNRLFGRLGLLVLVYPLLVIKFHRFFSAKW